jgi:hypothetical protein
VATGVFEARRWPFALGLESPAMHTQSKQWTQAQLRAKIDELADNGVFNARAVQTILRRREAGLTRQQTTAEIASLYCAQHHAWKCGQPH